MQSEKQISVDPISLIREPGNNIMMMYPVATGPKMEVMSVPAAKIISCSLPNSPRFDSIFAKHKKKSKNNQEARKVSPLGLGRQQSVALSNLERLRESHLRRSKSCGEGRASQPSLSVDDFDLWSTTNHQQRSPLNNETQYKEEEEEIIFHKKGGVGNGGVNVSKEGECFEDKFKCGRASSFRASAREKQDIVSQRVSLEKFECGSWRSSAIINYEEDGDTTSNLFFDLPVELIRCSSVNDAESPVTTGFVFDNKDHHHNRKGVLKNATTVATTTTSSSSIGQPRKSHESCNSSRHVRFSTSSPGLLPASPTSSCITPRLRKARDDFNAFLEAQSA
ncbi:hypothetical protein DH2020_036838 [Rehmannia glutinosa]|uniref:Uncharacterized protein n=1 Tax=Rehmannia glutinosa TaxID=99300 RepID=A0ABR0V4P6_REHGL